MILSCVDLRDDDLFAVTFDLHRKLERALDELGIPFPQRDVHLIREDAA